MILTINAIRDSAERQRFDQVVLPRLRNFAPADFSICHLVTDALPDDHTPFSHLLISGSELSAAEQNPTDQQLMEQICQFVDAGKPVLGICYGHQMVARALANDAVCRRATVPEFGWKELSGVGANPLFAGLERIVTMHSHYDEVFGLGEDFTVLASTKDCSVQAFQYLELPVWGVQFHPELGFSEGQRMLDRNLKSEPLAPELAGADLEGPEQAEANLLILKNFLQAQVVQAAA